MILPAAELNSSDYSEQKVPVLLALLFYGDFSFDK